MPVDAPHRSDAKAWMSARAMGLHFGLHGVGPFDFDLRAGEQVAILGPSGAGKSTLLRLLAKEAAPDAGQLVWQGRSMERWSRAELSRTRAVLPQSFDVAFGMPTELVIGLGRVARDHDPRGPHIVQQAAGLAHASHLLGRRFDTLSGGEKARAQMARIFAQLWDVENGLLMVDEPVASLDPGLQLEMLDSIHRFALERGHAVLAVLHDVQHALHGFERWLLIKDSRLLADSRCAQEVIEHLPALYGIPFVQAVSPCGQVLLSPARRAASPLPAQ
nr:ATP-binding cassette domain-containing protein [uncultured Rhodoferax sp.]